MTKSSALKVLARDLAKNFRKIPLDVPRMRQRYAYYIKRYHQARSYRNGTGNGVTDELVDTLGEGLTMGAVLDKLCPYFSRMDDLFGHRHNATAGAEYTAGYISSDEIHEEEDVPESGEVAATEEYTPGEAADGDDEADDASQLSWEETPQQDQEDTQPQIWNDTDATQNSIAVTTQDVFGEEETGLETQNEV